MVFCNSTAFPLWLRQHLQFCLQVLNHGSLNKIPDCFNGKTTGVATGLSLQKVRDHCSRVKFFLMTAESAVWFSWGQWKHFLHICVLKLKCNSCCFSAFIRALQNVWYYCKNGFLVRTRVLYRSLRNKHNCFVVESNWANCCNRKPICPRDLQGNSMGWACFILWLLQQKNILQQIGLVMYKA